MGVKRCALPIFVQKLRGGCGDPGPAAGVAGRPARLPRRAPRRRGSHRGRTRPRARHAGHRPPGTPRTGGVMTENAAQPTPEDVRASFSVVESYDVQAPDDPVAESERAVLGSVIQSAPAAREAAALLRPEHFA